MTPRSFAILSLALVAFTAFAVHSWTAALYRADIAGLNEQAALDVARANFAALVTERRNAEITHQLETAYVELSEQRAAAAVDTVRLESEISEILSPWTNQAFESLGDNGSYVAPGCLRDGTGSSDSVSGTAGSACNCAELRATNVKLARALERLVEGGGGIVADGQRAADVAAVAARFARETSKRGGEK